MKIKNILICDDIRHEMGGRVSAMGIIGDTINITVPENAPQEIQIPLAAVVTIEKIGNHKNIAMIMEISSGEKRCNPLEIQIELKGAGTLFHIPFPKFPIEVIESTDFCFEVTVLDQNKPLVKQKTALHVNLNRLAGHQK
jgi:hypothetical protein